MTRRTKIFAACLCLLAVVVLAAWPIWLALKPKPVSEALFARTKVAVDRNPQLRPAWDKAMEDGVLTWQEAKDILERAGEKVEPEN
jgi:hypothetical protein